MKRLTAIYTVLLIGACFTLHAQNSGPSTQRFDFTFNIPVELHKIHPDISHFCVALRVFPYDPVSYPNSQIGNGASQYVELSNGEFTGTVQVQFNANPGIDPATAVYYRAELWFSLKGPPRHQTWAGDIMETSGSYPHDPSQAYIVTVDGNLQSPIATSQSPNPANSGSQGSGNSQTGPTTPGLQGHPLGTGSGLRPISGTPPGPGR
jgi:hypothetical protein